MLTRIELLWPASVLLACVIGTLTTRPVMAETVYPIALLPFVERDRESQEAGTQVTDLLFANLIANPDLFLVDREGLGKILDELELNQSGLVNPDQAVKVGHLTGAKILVTGSVLNVGNSKYLIAKIIGTETSRVLGASVKGDSKDALDGLVENLAQQIATTVKKRAGDLIAQPVTRADRLKSLREKLGRGKQPTVFIQIAERHVGQATIDPAAETEVALFCTELGFDVIDSETGNQADAEILLLGEGFSEFASRHGDLISVKARLELKAVDARTGKLLTTDRHTSVAVDLTEQLAGKAALSDAAANLASRVLLKLTSVNKKK